MANYILHNDSKDGGLTKSELQNLAQAMRHNLGAQLFMQVSLVLASRGLLRRLPEPIPGFMFIASGGVIYMCVVWCRALVEHQGVGIFVVDFVVRNARAGSMIPRDKWTGWKLRQIARR